MTGIAGMVLFYLGNSSGGGRMLRRTGVMFSVITGRRRDVRCQRGVLRKTMILGLAIMGLLLLPGASAAVPARLEQVGTRWDPWGNFQFVFRLNNTSDRAISYQGYGPEWPIFAQQRRGATGWEAEKGGWCGTGLGKQKLAAHGSIVFTVPPPLEGGQTWRFGIAVTGPGYGSRPEMIWSGPLRAKPEADENTPGADALVHIHVVQHPGQKFPYTFTVRNVSERPVYYGGFREAQVPPIYLNAELRGQRWKNNGHSDWSGTGLGFQPLAPGRAISFSIPAQSWETTWRIGLQCYRTAEPTSAADVYRPVWGPALPPRKGK
jgi:hypothetical protein